MTPNNRGRRSTIRPYGSKPNITRGYSLEAISLGLNMNMDNMDHNNDDSKHDYMDSDDEDYDEDYIIGMHDKKKVDPMQSELV